MMSLSACQSYLKHMLLTHCLLKFLQWQFPDTQGAYNPYTTLLNINKAHIKDIILLSTIHVQRSQNTMSWWFTREDRTQDTLAGDCLGHACTNVRVIRAAFGNGKENMATGQCALQPYGAAL